MIASGVVLGVVGWRLLPRKWAYACIGIACVVFNPLLGVAAAGTAVGVRHWKSVSGQRQAAKRRTDETLLALDLLSLGSTAGLPFLESASAAADEIGGATSGDLRRAVTRVKAGLVHSLVDGPLAQAFDAAERSAVSGASLADSLVDLAQEVRAEQAALERERIERLPVKLLFPLAFLILPGFVLVAVVPSIVSGLGQLNL
jgi:hypothetical protein